jgi:ring-1,2-phenylacetyl-CoA epoxidase subunit PaaE
MKDFLELRIREIIRETADARTYVLENLAGPPPVYQAGQFLTLLLSRGGKEWRRSYSLSSAPDIDPYLAVTIKRVVNGEFSRYLLDTLRVGDIIRSLYPAGRFTLEIDPIHLRDIFLIGAGSGLTPLFSMLKTALHQELDSLVTFISSNKNPRSGLFRQQLASLANWHRARFNYLPLYSEPGEEDPYPPTRLKNSLLEELVQKHLTYGHGSARFYLCGPSDFMRMVQITLIFMGFPRENIRRENFVVEVPASAGNEISVDQSFRQVSLLFRQQRYLMQVPANRNLLQAALDQGIRLPYSCRAGRCAACVARCTRGRVRMSVNEVLTDREVAEGWVLTCVGYADTQEVVVEVPFASG